MLLHRIITGSVIAATFLAACGAAATPPAVAPTAAITSPPTVAAVATSAPTVAAVATSAPAAATPAAPTAPATAAPTASAATTQATAAPTALATAAPTAAAATAAATAAPTPLASAAFDPALAAELQGILDNLVSDGTIPGAVLAVSIPGMQPWSGAAGRADVAQGTAMTVDTRVRIASISKIFTAVVVLQLVEQGVLTLDTTVEERLPGLAPNGQELTVRRLLSHTTGLYDYLEDANFLARAYGEPEKVWQPAELVTYAVRNRSAFAPGAEGQWDYSSTNFVLLGMLVEQATGKSMAQEVRDRILTPLGMGSSYFVPSETVEGPQSQGYSRARDVTNVSMSFAFATANIVSTVGDEIRFAEGLFGGKLLKPETLRQMEEFRDGKGQYNMPTLGYGYGLMRNTLAVPGVPAEASTVYGHIGGFGGFRSALWHAPASGITIALGVNQGNTDPNILATRVFTAILRGRS